MNLYERFWNVFEERRQQRGARQDSFDVLLTPIHPPDGIRSEAARDLTALVHRSPRPYPPYVASQSSHGTRPFCVIFTVEHDELPEFHELFEQYVDKNAFVAEVFLRLLPHCEIPYVLFIGQKSFFLYDTALEELIRWGSDWTGLEETFFLALEEDASVMEAWNSITRKTNSQRAEEFARWLDLWKVGIGSRTNATPAFMQTLMQKVVLLYLYERSYGMEESDLALGLNFLEQRAGTGRGKRAAVDRTPFDGVAWLNQSSLEVLEIYDIEFLDWSRKESNFFSLMSAETRAQFSQFVLELFLLSQAKFTLPVQVEVFSDAGSKLKFWKFSVTETTDIRRKLHADDVNVYEPIYLDLEDAGIGWALNQITQILEHWRGRCLTLEKQLADRKVLRVQFDMFQQADLGSARIPTLADIFDTVFSSSVRVRYDYESERVTLEYLLILKIFELCQTWGCPLRSLGSLGDIFEEKESLARIEGI